MGNFNYARSKATADRLIKKFGKTTASKLIEPGAMTGDTWNPVEGPPIEHDCSAVVLDYSINQTDGVRILVGDRRVLVAVGNLNVTPKPDWLLSIKMKGDASAKNYRLMQIKPLEPGDLTLLWDMQCRAM